MKNNKIFTGISAFLLSAMAFTACTDDVKFADSFIEKSPGNTVSLDTVFNSATYTKQFLTGIYALQYYGLPYSNNRTPHSSFSFTSKLDAMTDLYQHHWNGADAYNLYYGGTLTAQSTPAISYSDDYVWNAVRQAWILINNVDRVPDLKENEKKSLVAQAKCLIASRYFDLYSVYGGLPWVGRTPFTGTEGVYENPRLTAEATCDSIVALLDEAIASDALPWKYYDGDGVSTEMDATNNTGRWTKGGAMALKAKVLLFNASPIYNSDKPYFDGNTEAEQQHLVWHGNYDQKRWQRALAACQDFFTANGESDPGDNKAADVNSTLGDRTYHLNGTQGAAWEIISSGSKKTSDAAKVDYYRQAYRMGYIYQGSAEVIHSTRVATVYGSQGTFSWWSWANPANGINRNSYNPTEEYVEMFPWSNGEPFDWEKDSIANRIYGEKGKLFYQYVSVRGGLNKIASRDPRLYENAFVNSQPKTLAWSTGASSGDIFELWLGGNDASTNALKLDDDGVTPIVNEKLLSAFATGYGTVKYVLGEEYHRKFMHWVYLSYDEMLLMFAECKAQTGDLEGALKLVNRVRARVGLGKLETYNDSYYKSHGGDITTDKDALVEQILRERACELGMSNNRYYDMVRYKRTDWMTKPLHGLGIIRMKKNSSNIYVPSYDPYIGNDKNAGLKEPNVFDYKKFRLQNRERVLWAYQDQPNNPEVTKWLLCPFPSSEIMKGYGLVQNPGW